jgi:23S rRNA (uracil1939-C5)-methyltransferase
MTEKISHKIRVPLHIDTLNARGEGMAHYDGHRIDVPYAIAGDDIIAEIDGQRGYLAEITHASADRIDAFCKHYGECGGCAVQTLSATAYAQWKHDLLAHALAKAHIDCVVEPMIDGHGEGRRRVTFHARYVHGLGPMRIDVGFMKARAHDIVSIDHCPLLSPALAHAVPVARAIAYALRGVSKPLDITITESDEGFDVDVRGCGALDEAARRHVLACADECDLARVSNHGTMIVERRAPLVRMGQAHVHLPAGGFLQATHKGEQVIAELVCAPITKAKRIADLFAGSGTLTLRLAEKGEVLAIESDEAAVKALMRAAHSTAALKAVHVERRDLFVRPLTAAELETFDVLVFDPPRAGAEAQARILARSHIPLVIAVSCNVQTFARDARLLCDGGYVCERVTPVDQFRHSPHVECVGVFRKISKTRKRSRLLG